MITRTHERALWHGQNLSCANGNKPRSTKRGGPKPRLEDELCLEARARHEFYGWDEYRLADHYGVNVEYMIQVIEYHSRVRLIAKPEHANIQ